jgi:predicted enzyme related to lactoylglutathione lyase
MAAKEGHFIWTDLSTPDCDTAKAFYSALLGWELEDVPSPMGTYVVGKVDGKEVAGMMSQSPEQSGVPPMWQIYLKSDRIEDTLERIMSHGGSTLVPPFEIPDGRIAIVADPTGAGFCLMEVPEAGGFEIRGIAGTVCWAEVLTRDPDTAIEFYTTVFGFDARTEPSATGSLYTTLMHEGQPMLGLMPMPPMVPAAAPAFWQIYFQVDDLDDTMAHAKDLGAAVLAPKMQIGDKVWFATLLDPQGAGFSILEGEM